MTSGGPGAVIRYQDPGRLRLGFDYYLTDGGGLVRKKKQLRHQLVPEADPGLECRF
ncbi:MAG: hypothetical protein VZR11_05715 [Succinimonas sp.]|nr:hypothetical protein [Succinimonas sp.]